MKTNKPPFAIDALPTTVKDVVVTQEQINKLFSLFLWIRLSSTEELRIQANYELNKLLKTIFPRDFPSESSAGIINKFQNIFLNYKERLAKAEEEVLTLRKELYDLRKEHRNILNERLTEKLNAQDEGEEPAIKMPKGFGGNYNSKEDFR